MTPAATISDACVSASGRVAFQNVNTSPRNLPGQISFYPRAMRTIPPPHSGARFDVVSGDASGVRPRGGELGAVSADGYRRRRARAMGRRALVRSRAGGDIISASSRPRIRPGHRATVHAGGAKTRAHRRPVHPRASRQSRRDGRPARAGRRRVRKRGRCWGRRAHRSGHNRRGAHPAARGHRYLPHRRPVHRGGVHVQLLARRPRRPDRGGDNRRCRHAQRTVRRQAHHEAGLRPTQTSPRVLSAVRRAVGAAQGGGVSPPRR